MSCENLKASRYLFHNKFTENNYVTENEKNESIIYFSNLVE